MTENWVLQVSRNGVPVKGYEGSLERLEKLRRSYQAQGFSCSLQPFEQEVSEAVEAAAVGEAPAEEVPAEEGSAEPAEEESEKPAEPEPEAEGTG